jgi:hypothetical protein
MHYREYNPSVGRWLSQDPIGISARDSNYYGYAKNRPAIKKDPLGLADEGSDFGNPFIPYPDYWAGQVEASFNGAKAAGEIVAVGGGVAASGCAMRIQKVARALWRVLDLSSFRLLRVNLLRRNLTETDIMILLIQPVRHGRIFKTRLARET